MPDNYGIWQDWECTTHHHSTAMLRELIRLHQTYCPGMPVVDYGCGDGYYVKGMAGQGIEVLGVEGSELADGQPLIQRRNLCEDFDALPGRERMAVCLEVGEHIPAQFTDALLTNVCRSAPVVALSWALRGQRGVGHVNCLNNAEVIDMLKQRGYEYLPGESAKVREAIRRAYECLWFAATFMLFRRL